MSTGRACGSGRFTGRPTEGPDRLGEIHREDFAAQIGGNLLQFIETARRPRPKATCRPRQEGSEILPPLLACFFAPVENTGQRIDQLAERGIRPRERASAVVAGCYHSTLGTEDGCPRMIPPFLRFLRRLQQSGRFVGWGLLGLGGLGAFV